MTVYEIVTGKLIAALERGTVPWRRPWRGADGAPRNIASGKDYRGINSLLLGMAGYRSPVWGTMKQVNTAGGNVRRGERSTLVVFWKELQITGKDADGEPCAERIPMMRYYLVFNADQCDSLKLPAPAGGDPAPVEPLAAGIAVVAGMPNRPPIKTGGKACYYPGQDVVEMPASDRFVSAPEYYSTLFHELVHSTGHESRLNRKTLREQHGMGSADYSREELVAEMGASFVCAAAGIDHELEQSAAYLAAWIKVLRGDSRMAVAAAGQAQKAADYILNRQRPAAAAAGQGS